jgi:DNA primase
MAHDIQAIYSILLAKGYQEQLFSGLGGTLKKEKGGRETLVRCPFCNTEHKFSYNRDKPVWRCWHCGEAGDWIAYLNKAQGIDFKAAVLELAHAAGVEVSYDDRVRYDEYTRKANILEAAQTFFIETMNRVAGKPVKEYLLSRGYSEADIGGMPVGAYVDRSELLKHLESCGFGESEIRRSGLFTDQAGRAATAKAADLLARSGIRPYVVTLPSEFNDPDEFVRAQGTEAFENLLKQAERWPRWQARHICQSHDLSTDRGMDCALEQAAEAQARHVDALDQRFFLDSLKAATGLGEECAGRLQQHQQKIAQQRAKSTFQAMLMKLQQVTSSGDPIAVELDLERGLQDLRAIRGFDVPEPYLLADFEREINKTPDGLLTGYAKLDSFLRIPRGAVSILAGRPGHGKTTMQLNLLLNFLRQ